MKKPYYIGILIIFQFACSNILAQKFDWLKHAGGIGNEYVSGMAHFEKYIYVIGNHGNFSVFDSITLTTNGSGEDIFLAKYDTSGNFYWAKSFGGPHSDRGMDVAVDNYGNVFVSGTFEGDTAYFDNIKLIGIRRPGDSQFLAKLDTSGNFLWAKSITSHFTGDIFGTIKITSYGNYIYVLGTGYEDSLFYDNNFIQKGSSDSYLLKIKTNGTLVWNKQIEINGTSYSINVDIASGSGAVYVAGDYRNSISLSNRIVYASGSNTDLYIAKIDTSGSLNWLKTTYDSTTTYLNALTLDDVGNLYLTGPIYPNSFKFDTLSLSNGSMFLLKLNSNGNVVYGNSYGSTMVGTIGGDIHISKSKEIYITGTFRNTFLLDVNDTIFTMGNNDVLLLKLDSLGKILWGHGAGGSDNDWGLGIVTDTIGNAYMAGNFSGMAKFGTRKFNSAGNNDIFITKLSDCNAFTANFEIIGDSISCNSISTHLKAHSALGYTFQWQKNGLPIPAEKYPNLFPTDSGYYSVIVNNNGCIDTSRSIYVTFVTVPPVSIQPFDTICLNSAPILLNAASPSGGIWSGNGVDSTYFHPSIAGVGPTKITYTYSNGQCSDSAFQFIYVKTSPMPSISGQKMVCTNSSAYTYSVSGASGLSYQWSVSGGNILSGQGTASVKVEWGSPGIGVLELMAVSSGNSQCDTSIVQDSIYISGQKINADIFGADSVCANISYKYSTQALGLLYQWQVKGGQIVSGSNTSSIEVVWDKVSQGTLYLRVFNACYSDTIVRDTVAINSIPKPQIVGSTQHCAFTSKVPYTAINAANSYSWSIHGGNLVSGQGTDSILVDWGGSAQGKIVLTETGSNGCSDTAQLNVQLLTVPTTVLNESICSGESFFFNGQNLGSAGNYSDTLTGTNGCDSLLNLTLDVNQVNVNVNVSNDTLMALQAGGSYQWLSCNGGNFVPLSGDTSRILTAVQTGNYAVAIEKDGCRDTSACIPFVTVGMNERTAAISYKMYPNPSSGLLYVEMQMKINKELMFNLYNAIGGQVLSKKLSTGGNFKLLLDLKELPKGLYFIEILASGERRIEKLILQ